MKKAKLKVYAEQQSREIEKLKAEVASYKELCDTYQRQRDERFDRIQQDADRISGYHRAMAKIEEIAKQSLIAYATDTEKFINKKEN